MINFVFIAMILDINADDYKEIEGIYATSKRARIACDKHYIDSMETCGYKKSEIQMFSWTHTDKQGSSELKISDELSYQVIRMPINDGPKSVK